MHIYNVEYYAQVMNKGKAMEVKSVLRYPGGKQRAVKILADFVPHDETEICSPFLGGGSFELYCASAMKMRVYGYDNFSPLVEFWQMLFSRGKQIADQADSFLPVLKRDTFYQLQKTQSQLEGKIARAAAFYVINRASFSGCTLSGGMSPGHLRFTPSSVERLRNFPAAAIKSYFSVAQMDFADSISRHRRGMIYADPPYFLRNQNLYGDRGKARESFDHQKLRDILVSRGGRWLLSYNECEEVRKLYHGHVMHAPKWRYGMSKNKSSRELLVLSNQLSEELGDLRGMANAA